MKKPYDDRSDLEKLQTQWNKIDGLYERREWSAAIVRAVTSAEIAANIAVRMRFAAESKFKAAFVDSLLVWANGIDGKFRRLIIPSEPDTKRRAVLNRLHREVAKLNDKRNAIVHRGAFASEEDARDIVERARFVAQELVSSWEPEFELKPRLEGCSNSG